MLGLIIQHLFFCFFFVANGKTGNRRFSPPFFYVNFCEEDSDFVDKVMIASPIGGGGG